MLLLGTVLGQHRGQYWRHLEASWSHIGTLLGPVAGFLGAPLGASGGSLVLILAPPWAPRGTVLDRSRTDP